MPLIVHVFVIFNESLLALSQRDSFFISMFKYFFNFWQIFPLDKDVSIFCIHNGKDDLRHST